MRLDLVMPETPDAATSGLPRPTCDSCGVVIDDMRGPVFRSGANKVLCRAHSGLAPVRTWRDALCVVCSEVFFVGVSPRAVRFCCPLHEKIHRRRRDE